MGTVFYLCKWNQTSRGTVDVDSALLKYLNCIYLEKSVLRLFLDYKQVESKQISDDIAFHLPRETEEVL